MRRRIVLGLLVLAVCIGLLSAMVSALTPTIWYVSAAGDDENAGTETAPFETLDKAVEEAETGDIIQVLTDLTVTQTIPIEKSLTIRGAAEKPCISQPTSAVQTSIFSLASDVSLKLEQLEFDGSEVDSSGSTASNPFYGGVVSVSGTGTTAFLQNISVTIRNCDIHDFEGYCGGAVCFHYAEKIELKIYNSTFTGNTANVSGGAVAFINCKSTSLHVEESTFSANTAQAHGGAIATSGGYDQTEKISISSSEFLYNRLARTTTTKIYGGAAIGVSHGSGAQRTVTIQGCQFRENKSDDMGGAVFVNATKTLLVDRNHFIGNTSKTHGGAMHIACGSENTAVTITGNLFENNVSEGQGGALNLSSGGLQTTMASSLFQANTTDYQMGNAIVYFASSQAATESHLYATNGAAFVENGAPDDGIDRDTLYIQTTQGHQATLSVTDYMPDGTRMNWKVLAASGEESRLVDADPEAYRLIDLGQDSSLELYLDQDTQTPTWKDEEYSNILRGNHALYGGAICNYGSLTIGEPGRDIQVEKRWVDGDGADLSGADDLPEQVTVELIRETDGKSLETATLSADDLWKHTFYGFPTNVAFRLTERVVEGYTTQVTVQGNKVQVVNTKDDEGLSIWPILPGVDGTVTPRWLNTEDHYAYIVGYQDGTVKPGNSITRAEVATIFFRLLTADARAYFWSDDSGFSDVSSDAWYHHAVATMVQVGVLTGYNDGTFRPNAPITRAEFATMAARFLSNPYASGGQFSDIEGHWAQAYIARAAEVGWIHGYGDGTFRPNQDITRAEAVTLVNAVLGRAPHEDHLLADMVTWPDNLPSQWHYEAIQEATNSHAYVWAGGKSYEIWTALEENRDWAALEKAWAESYA